MDGTEDRFESPAPTASNSIGFTIEAEQRLCWAMVVNGIPILRRIRVTNTSSEPIRGAYIEARPCEQPFDSPPSVQSTDTSDSLSCQISEVRNQESESSSEIRKRADMGISPPWLRLPIPDLAPDEAWAHDNLPLEIPETLVRSATERRMLTLDLKLFQRTRLLCFQRLNLEILAFNEWDRTRLPELLAAFVTPNHPSITKALRRVRDSLQIRTGDPTMSGYRGQSRDRVRAIADAVFGAISELGITYTSEPPSFESTGQKIRLGDDLLQNRMGNCIEVSLLVASIFELAGLHPVVALFRGHACPGVWLICEWLPVASSDDIDVPRKLVRCGDMILFDATGALSRPPASFAYACGAATKLLAEEGFDCVVDIRAARISRILPLPLLREYSPMNETACPSLGGASKNPAQPKSGGGNIRPIATSPRGAGLGLEPGAGVGLGLEPGSSAGLGPEPGLSLEPGSYSDHAPRVPPKQAVKEADPRSEGGPENIQMSSAAPDLPRLCAWKSRLLDLSLRNRLLNFRASADRTIPFAVEDLPGLEDLVAGGSILILEPAVAATADDPRSSDLVKKAGGDDFFRAECRRLLSQKRLLTTLEDAELNRRLRVVFRQARTELEETGSSTLFLALGF